MLTVVDLLTCKNVEFKNIEKLPNSPGYDDTSKMIYVTSHPYADARFL
jgi:hypothetical protein